jgi:hypothetical protein
MSCKFTATPQEPLLNIIPSAATSSWTPLRLDTLKSQTSRSTVSSRLDQGIGGKQVTLIMTLHAPNDAMSCELTMVEENGQWKVERLSVR